MKKNLGEKEKEKKNIFRDKSLSFDTLASWNSYKTVKGSQLKASLYGYQIYPSHIQSKNVRSLRKPDIEIRISCIGAIPSTTKKSGFYQVLHYVQLCKYVNLIFLIVDDVML